MAGGFSYPLSQLNRTTQSQRQPGSSLKPFTYLAALRRGLQPNTLVRDQQITLPPIGNSYNARDRDYWTPKNADGDGGGITTLRRGLENSKNLVTANLLDGGIDTIPAGASPASASSPSTRRSTAPASPIIPSCSAPSRRASSTWRLSMPPSPMKAAFRALRHRRSSRTAAGL